MTKSIDQFGGWLMFFYVTTMIFGIIASIVTSIPNVFEVFAIKDIYMATDYMAILLNLIIFVILNIKIFIILKTKDPSIPQRVVNKMIWILFVCTIFPCFRILFVYNLVDNSIGLMMAKDVGKEILRMLIWFLVWTSYFRKSKRVALYYGRNAV